LYHALAREPGPRGDEVLRGRRDGVHRAEPPPAPAPGRAGERHGGGGPRSLPPPRARALDRDDGRHGGAQRRRVRDDVESPADARRPGARRRHPDPHPGHARVRRNHPEGRRARMGDEPHPPALPSPHLDVGRAHALRRLCQPRGRLDAPSVRRTPGGRARTNMFGIVAAMDLLSGGAEAATLDELKRPPYYVPETKRIDDLLREMQRSRAHMAVVVDEYGGSTGVVTLEDILEQIVGEIHDEHERAPSSAERLPDGSYRVAARTNIDELNEAFDWTLPKQDY